MLVKNPHVFTLTVSERTYGRTATPSSLPESDALGVFDGRASLALDPDRTGDLCSILENIYERLQVSSRTAAVTRAFRDRVA